jgi:multidrug efflux pump subunit AcrA (membrane-fusion protein)
MGFLSACEQNTFVRRPPPKVDVAVPAQGSFHALSGRRPATPAAIKSVDLVARVQGFLQSIELQGRRLVKEGARLFTIEPEPTS